MSDTRRYALWPLPIAAADDQSRLRSLMAAEVEPLGYVLTNDPIETTILTDVFDPEVQILRADAKVIPS